MCSKKSSSSLVPQCHFPVFLQACLRVLTMGLHSPRFTKFQTQSTQATMIDSCLLNKLTVSSGLKVLRLVVVKWLSCSLSDLKSTLPLAAWHQPLAKSKFLQAATISKQEMQQFTSNQSHLSSNPSMCHTSTL